MKNTIYEQTEAKLKAYFESLIIRDSLHYKLKVLNRHKKEIEEELMAGGGCKDLLEDVNAQILKLNYNLRLLEKEFAGMEFLLDTLSERDRQIIISRYRDKKSYRSIGFALYLSESRVHQIRSGILNYLYDKLEF